MPLDEASVPARSVPARAVDVTTLDAALERAIADYADGRPARAARSIRALEAKARSLPPSPAAARLLARAAIELAKSDFELRGDAIGLIATAELSVIAAHGRGAGVGEGWKGLRPAVAGLRGLLLLRSGRNDDALVALDEAVAGMADADPPDACRFLLNRGVLHMERGAITLARADLTACEQMSRDAGLSRLLFKAQHNLGYLEFVAGRLPQALELMTAAERSLPGPPRPIALLDRARVLIEAGLVGVAEASLTQAAALFAHDRLGHDLAQCEVSLAECALLRNDPVVARDLAASALRRFSRRDDAAWSGWAELLVLMADASRLAAAAGPGLRVDDPAQRAEWRAVATRAARVEVELADAGRRVWAQTAQLARIEAELAGDLIDDPAAVLRTVGAVSPGDPIGTRLQGRQVRGLLAMRAGLPGRAARYVREGQVDLARHRAGFGSLDLNTAAAVHGTRLAETAVDLAGRSWFAVIEAVERSRNALGPSVRVTPPADPEQAALLAELRVLLEAARGTELLPTGHPDRVRLRRDALRLKEAVLARSWATEASGVAPLAFSTIGLRDAVETVRGRLVVMVEHRGHLLAVIREGGSAEVVELGPAATVREAALQLHADLGVVAHPLVPLPLREAADRSARSRLQWIETTLGAAVTTDADLTVVTHGWLDLVPWSMLPVRRGRPTVSSPSVRHGHGTSDRLVDGDRPVDGLRRTVVAGPGLAAADAEAAAVAEVWDQVTMLTGAAATTAAVRAALSSGGLVHVAAHGNHETDNPLFSSLRLADGPLFAHEIEAGEQPPSLVVLSSCEVGRSSARDGGEVIGFAGVLLRHGVHSVVAAQAPVRDDTAAEVMSGLHARLRAGAPVAAAVAEVTSQWTGRTGELLPFACYGAPLR